MKLKLIVLCICFFSAAVAFAERAQPERPDPNPEMDKSLEKIQAMKSVQNILKEFSTEDAAKSRFKEHMEVVRISSPSRQEVYRGMELAKRYKEAGFKDTEIVFSKDGVMPGAGIQLVDGLPVWNVCAIIEGTTPADPKNGVYSRPKILIEGHIDTVNPAKIDISDTSKIPQATYDTVRITPISTPVVSTPAELKAIKESLHFDANNKIIEDENFKKVYRRFANAEKATEGGAYRMYIPGISDAMSNTMSVYQMAKLFKKYKVKPVYDIWFCGTSGEEGRGNLAGMKQLYGYNQQANEMDNSKKGKNTLNFVANLSIDGGGGYVMAIHYLGSYRFEVNYTALNENGNAAVAAAKAITAISDVLTPMELDPAKIRSTYTVGIAYANGGDGKKSTSFEVDMRSLVPDALNETRAILEPKFAAGVNKDVKFEIEWFGDRPAFKRNYDDMAKDPLIYAGWKTYDIATGNNLTLAQYPKKSSSLNDNVPAAVGVPSVNLSISNFSAKDGAHAFNEWGVLGPIETEAANFKHVLLTLLSVSGVHDEKGGILVPAAYGKVGPRHVDGTKDSWNK